MGATRQHDYDRVCVEYRNRTRRLERLLRRVMAHEEGAVLRFDIQQELDRPLKEDNTP